MSDAAAYAANTDHMASPGPSAAVVSTLAPRRKPITRSRNGCLVCRSRRVKCDAARPSCANCEKYGAECTWPKPQRAGQVRQIISKPSATRPDSSRDPLPPSQSAPSQWNTGHLHQNTSEPQRGKIPRTELNQAFGYPAALAVLDDVDRFLALCNNTRMSSFFSRPTPAPEFLRVLFPIRDDLRCFHHCITYTLSIIVTSEDRNPWTDHVARLFLAEEQGILGSTAIKNALLYLGAVHLSYLQGRDGDSGEGTETRALALRYRSSTINTLRIMLEDPAELLRAAFFSAAALCLTADLLAAQPRWRQSIRIARKGIARCGGCSALLSASSGLSPALKCAIESLVNLSLCCTLSSAESYLILGATDLGDADTTWWSNLDIEEITNPETGRFESLCGVSREMLQMFSDLMSRMPARGVLASSNQTALHEPDALYLSWNPDIALVCANDRIAAGTLAFWHAGKIMIWMKRCGAQPNDPRVQYSVSEIFRVCGSVGDKVEYLNWPIIIACWVTRDDAQRNTARNLLKSFVIQCCYEIEVIQTLVELMWTRFDSGEDLEACEWSEILIDLGSSVVLG